MRNKKGQEMSVATLVLIVIGVILLVLLILGFTMGWQNLWDKINIFGGGADIDAVVQSCGIASATDAMASYCDEFKQVDIAGETQYVNCQYSAVQNRLDKALSCGDDRDKNFCQSLDQSQQKFQDTVVNGKTCKVIMGTDKTTGTGDKTTGTGTDADAAAAGSGE